MLLRFLFSGFVAILTFMLVSCSNETTDTQSSDEAAISQVEEPSARDTGSVSPQVAVTDVDVPATESPVPADEQLVTLHQSAVSWTAVDIDGNIRSSAEWIGKQPVVINFWGTWCPPCRREIPDLVKVYEEYNPKGIEIISFALRDTPDQVRAYSARANMKWVMLMGGDDKILRDYRFSGGVPTTIFLDKTGKEVGRFIGPRTLEVFKQAFDALL